MVNLEKKPNAEANCGTTSAPNNGKSRRLVYDEIVFNLEKEIASLEVTKMAYTKKSLLALFDEGFIRNWKEVEDQYWIRVNIDQIVGQFKFELSSRPEIRVVSNKNS